MLGVIKEIDALYISLASSYYTYTVFEKHAVNATLAQTSLSLYEPLYNQQGHTWTFARVVRRW